MPYVRFIQYFFLQNLPHPECYIPSIAKKFAILLQCNSKGRIALQQYCKKYIYFILLSPKFLSALSHYFCSLFLLLSLFLICSLFSLDPNTILLPTLATTTMTTCSSAHLANPTRTQTQLPPRRQQRLNSSPFFNMPRHAWSHSKPLLRSKSPSTSYKSSSEIASVWVWCCQVSGLLKLVMGLVEISVGHGEVMVFFFFYSRFFCDTGFVTARSSIWCCWVSVVTLGFFYFFIFNMGFCSGGILVGSGQWALVEARWW